MSTPDLDRTTPELSGGVKRRSSRISIYATLTLLLVTGLWIVFCFSTPVSNVHPYPVVPRAPFTPASAPIDVVLSGGPPKSSIATPLAASDSIRAIDVEPGVITLYAGGLVTRTIPMPLTPTTDLSTITRAVADPTWIAETSPGVFRVATALVLRHGIGLDVSAPTTQAIHLVDLPGVFIGIDGASQSVLSGITIDVVDGPAAWGGPLTYRPFLVFDHNAAVQIDHSILVGLGWDWNQSYGVSWMRGATGSLEHSLVTGNFIGVYCQQVSNLSIFDNRVIASHLYGIDPHTSSRNLRIIGNVASGNAAHGIILAKDVTASVIAHNRASRNGEDGIVLDEHSTGNRIISNTSSWNRGDGIALNDSPHATIVRNVIAHNRIGIINTRSSPTGPIVNNVIRYNRLALKDLDVNTATNTVDPTDTGLTLSPPPSWSWIITWIAWPLVALLFVWAFVLRRRELARGWKASRGTSSDADLQPPRSWRTIRRGNASGLISASAVYDEGHPITVLPPAVFLGPPPEPIRPVAPRIEVAPDGAEILPSGDESGAPPGDRRFRPDVQGLRALAVTLVVLFHAGVPGLTGGFVGVDVFFVISGFVISGLLLRERANSGKTSLLTFYARRAKRILPASTLVILATILASFHWLGFIRGASVASDGRWAAVFLENFHAISVGTDYFGAHQAISPLLHYWSLAVEEQFYLVFPLLFMVAATVLRRRNPRLRLGILLAIVIAGSLALSITQTHSDPIVAYYSPFTRAWELALGGLVACVGPALVRMDKRVAAILSWLGVAGILVAGFVYSGATAYPGSAAILPVGATALVIAAGFAAPRFGAEWLLGRWLVIKLGDISFSLYLWHFPVLVIAAQAATHPLSGLERTQLVALAVALSIATYALLENPVRHAKSLSAQPGRSIAIGVGLVISTVLIASALVNIPGGSTSQGAASRSTRPVASSAGLDQVRAQVAAGATLRQLPAPLIPPLTTKPSFVGSIPDTCVVSKEQVSQIQPCILGDTASTRTMVLLGDSQAAVFAEGFDQMAKVHHYRLVVLAKDECPPWLASYVTTSGGVFPACDAWHKFEVSSILSLHPDAVVVAGASGKNWQSSSEIRAINDLVRVLSPSVAKIAILSNMPSFLGRLPSLIPPNCLLSHPDDLKLCNLSASSWHRSQLAFRVTLQSAAKLSGAKFVNIDDLFCTQITCPVVVARHQVYFDFYHIMASYGSFVSPALWELLKPVLR